MFSYTPTFYTSKSSSHILRGYIFKTWPGNQFLLQHFSICHWTEGWQSGHETKLTPGLCIFDGRPFINRLPPLLVIHSNAPRFRPLFLSIVSSDLVSLHPHPLPVSPLFPAFFSSPRFICYSARPVLSASFHSTHLLLSLSLSLSTRRPWLAFSAPSFLRFTFYPFSRSPFSSFSAGRRLIRRQLVR